MRPGGGGVQRAVLVQVSFAVPFSVFCRKNMTGDNAVFWNWNVLGVKKKIQAESTKQDLGSS